MIDFLFMDSYTGEYFFVELTKGSHLSEAISVLAEYGILEEMCEFICIVSEEEANILGYDTY